jgi:enterochelin esterase-like enzyme
VDPARLRRAPARTVPGALPPAGADGSRIDWLDFGRAKQILDNLAVQRRIEPMVVVLGDGSVSDFQRELRTVARAVRREYNIARDPAHQALAGASAGGTQVLRSALSHPGQFAYVGSFAGPLADEHLRIDGRAVNAGTRLLRLYTGNMTDPAYNDTYRTMRTLDRAGVRYDFDGVDPDGGHNWNAWRDDLADFLPRLFRPVRHHGPRAGNLPLNREFTSPAPGTTPTPWLTRDANGDTFVTAETGTEFTAARRVTLWGNWAPGGSWVNVPLTRTGDRWRGTVGPLKPWFYYYKFIVDLVSKKDLSNPTSITSEPTWSSFLAPGRAARPLTDVPAGQGGALTTLTYDSTVVGAPRSAYVWTPPGYDPHRADPYPVLYLQHGSGQSYTDWVEMGRAKQILDNGFHDGNIVPMVVVMGNGNVPDFGRSFWTTSCRPPAPATTSPTTRRTRRLPACRWCGFQTFDVLKTILASSPTSARSRRGSSTPPGSTQRRSTAAPGSCGSTPATSPTSCIRSCSPPWRRWRTSVSGTTSPESRPVRTAGTPGRRTSSTLRLGCSGPRSADAPPPPPSPSPRRRRRLEDRDEVRPCSRCWTEN